ncbi:Oxygen sensor histidine kinase NreB [Neomoorella glycerini]|uniref:histidine kinase n=1 Tax=Neomoorella glycerini TaxID=55779 RepID=A0A6I5ZWC4_9FIRM|nr:Oxygen sensor histidine kinase NreB [Moorella glycerini]
MNWLSGQLISMQEKERERLARDLHDGLGQDIVAQKLQLESVLAALSHKEKINLPQIKLNIKEIIGGIERIGEEVRRISFDLMPSMLESLGLKNTLEWMSEQFSIASGLKVDLEIYGVGPERLPPNIEVALFRVFQEALNNISKHAQPSRVSLKLSYVYPKLIAVIADDGQGFEP